MLYKGVCERRSQRDITLSKLPKAITTTTTKKPPFSTKTLGSSTLLPQTTTKMKYTVALSALAASAMAWEHKSSACPKPEHTTTVTVGQPSATPTPPANDNGYFGVISSRSASPIHLLPLTARGNKFYLGGGPPSSYCPVESVGAANCPPGNTTVLAGGDQTLSLGVVVPGGQQVYVAPDGALSYTTAHSAAIPEGSEQTGFSRTAPTNGNAFGYLNFDTGFVACPAANVTADGYQVFGQVASGATFGDDCLGFSALTVAVDQPGAWQY